jgi:hypothetical protein
MVMGYGLYGLAQDAYTPVFEGVGYSTLQACLCDKILQGDTHAHQGLGYIGTNPGDDDLRTE